MQRLHLSGHVLPVGARLMVRHQFEVAGTAAVEAVYAFMLPRDAALRRFRIHGPGFSVRSECKPVGEAREIYEKGIEEGHLSALAQSYQDGMTNLAVGNLRPGDRVNVDLEIVAGVEVRDDGFRFRFPFTLAPSYHARARAGRTAPEEAELELPEELFGDGMLPPFRLDGKNLHEVTFDLTLESVAGAAVGSPSHSVLVRHLRDGYHRVALAPANDIPNRDLVLEVRAAARLQVYQGKGEDRRRHFAVLLPSKSFGPLRSEPRSVVFLLDRSGSMGGAPIQQARKALLACLAALEETDRFGIVAFDHVNEAFRPQLERATKENREQARYFLDGIHARGGTELAAGVKAAAQLFGQQGGDLFVLTDGQVFGTEVVLAHARASRARLHCLGIGSASQDRFLTLLARETGGQSRFVTPRERVDLSALELFASVGRPVAENFSADCSRWSGSLVEPAPEARVFAGRPQVVMGEGPAGGDGTITFCWDRAGRRESLDVTLPAEEGSHGETLRLLRGARLITDLEARSGTSANQESEATGRGRKRMRSSLRQLSLHYGLASREVALVAVVEREGDHPGMPPQTRVIPVGLPQDMEARAVFGAPGSAVPSPLLPASVAGLGATARFADPFLQDVCRVAEARAGDRAAGFAADPGELVSSAPPEMEAGDVDLMDLAAALEDDGGLPGRDIEERMAATLLALLALLAEGEAGPGGRFQPHAEKMIRFVEGNAPALPAARRKAAARVVEMVRAGTLVESRWTRMALEFHAGRHSAVGPVWRRLQAL